MADWVSRLWQGEVRLASAFWEYAMVFGTFAHVITTGLAYGAFVAGVPVWLAVVLFLVAAPYTLLVTVGVWRSADRYKGPAHWAHAARIAVSSGRSRQLCCDAAARSAGITSRPNSSTERSISSSERSPNAICPTT